jgi:hypothetical protein
MERDVLCISNYVRCLIVDIIVKLSTHKFDSDIAMCFENWIEFETFYLLYSVESRYDIVGYFHLVLQDN